MKRLVGLWRSVHATALLAVALLTFATAKSVVMEATPAVSPICSMDMSAGRRSEPAGKSTHAPCAYCAAAMHAPLISAPPSVAAPCAVAWAPAIRVPAEGRRDSHRIRANARAPPIPLTAA